MPLVTADRPSAPSVMVETATGLVEMNADRKLLIDLVWLKERGYKKTFWVGELLTLTAAEYIIQRWSRCKRADGTGEGFRWSVNGERLPSFIRLETRDDLRIFEDFLGLNQMLPVSEIEHIRALAAKNARYRSGMEF